MSLDIFDMSVVKRCADINKPEDYSTFLTDVREMAKARSIFPVTQELFNPSKPPHEEVHVLPAGAPSAPPDTGVEQATALIFMAAHDTDNVANEETLNRVLLEATHSLTRLDAVVSNAWRIAAAALYVVTQRAGDDAYLRKLILASDPFTPSQASTDALFFLVKFMGFSSNETFAPLLCEVLRQRYHFCSPHVTANALKHLGVALTNLGVELGVENLDDELDEDEGVRLRSVRPIEGYGGSGIRIYEDENYTGYSHCPTCRFFPCRINYYFAGAIQDCKFWNRVDPETLGGDIVDYRNWGNHLVVERDADNRTQDEVWRQARRRMLEKAYCDAIPFLCESLLSGQIAGKVLSASIEPLAWIYLSDCFSVHGEKGLSFIAMREAVRCKGQISHTNVAEQRKVESFDNNPEAIVGQTTNPDDIELKAINYKERKEWVKALDCYVYVNSCNSGKSAGNWYQMGECHRELGEYSLAELFMRRGAAMTPEMTLRHRFSDGADEARKGLLNKQDIGLFLERRKEERKVAQARIDCGFRMDTYEFVEISETAKRETRKCQGIGDYFGVSKAAYMRGELELAIQIMEAAVNHTPFYTSKARPLHMGARILSELHEYDKAMKYLEWAMELKPGDENVRNTWEDVAEMRDLERRKTTIWKRVWRKGKGVKFEGKR